MDIDPEPLPEPTAETQDQPMETEQSEPSPGTFQPEVGDAQIYPVPDRKYQFTTISNYS